MHASVIMWYSQIKSNGGSTTCSKKCVGSGFMEGGLCSFVLWEERKEIWKKKLIKKGFCTWEKL